MILLACLAPSIALAQPAPQDDISPTLLIETGPSDRPDYRRMVTVKYITPTGVSAAYSAYNRSEFARIPEDTPETVLQECRTGRATTIEDVRAYQAEEANARRAGLSAVPARFCIRNVSAWEAGNRKTWLDPIFEGLPHAASLNN